MQKLLICMAASFGASAALAQSLPSPIFNNVTVNGAIKAPELPNLSSSVEGTGTPGLDGAHWMIFHAPSTVADASNASLRVQRSASYPNSGETGTAKAIWGLGYTSPVGSFDEWTITGELHNQTDATLGTPSGGGSPENVAVNGTAFKSFASGFSYGAHEISPTWGGNFVCNDQTGVVSPWNACIGTEIDNYYVGGVGPDTHNSRVGLQIAWGGQGTPLATDHVAYGILMGGNSIGVMDHALYFGGAGTYGIGLDFSGASFATAPVFLAGGQKIVFDGSTTGTYNWALSDIAGTMALRYGSTNGMTLDSYGNFNATGAIASSAAVSANGSVTAGTTLNSTGNANIGGNVNLSGGNKITFDWSGTTYNWALSDISGTMALQYGGANRWTTDSSGNFGATGSIGSSANISAAGYVKAQVIWSIGSSPTPTGTCSINTQLGGNTAGSFKANGACASGTIILSMSTTATNGYACTASDLTTPADTIKQTAYSTTSATFQATMAASDLVTFNCVAF